MLYSALTNMPATAGAENLINRLEIVRALKGLPSCLRFNFLLINLDEPSRPVPRRLVCSCLKSLYTFY